MLLVKYHFANGNLLGIGLQRFIIFARDDQKKCLRQYLIIIKSPRVVQGVSNSQLNHNLQAD